MQSGLRMAIWIWFFSQKAEPGLRTGFSMKMPFTESNGGSPSAYDYQCALHDNLGMVGKVVVRP
jgi:plastocyanin